MPAAGPPPSSLPSLFRAAAYGADSREARRLSRGAARGTLVAVHAGVFARSSEWSELDDADRHRLRVRAAIPSLRSRLVVSHCSAVAVHRLPLLGEWPRAVHATDPERLRGQSWNGVVVHAGPIGGGDVELIDGLRVTTIERTAVDVALTAPFAAAVATIDATLRRPGVSSPALLAALAASPHARGRVAARRALEFASPRSDSAGESWCRCRLLELGAPSPELQRIFSDSLGDIGAVDFWFAEYGVVIEFDGDIKYLNERYRNGRSASRVVLDERRRERRLLALPEVRTVVRVDWRDLVEPWRLRRLLVEAGVPVR